MRKSRRKNILISSLLLLLLAFTAFRIYKVDAQILAIAIYSFKQEYFLSDGIKLFGNLTYQGEKVYDGIIALQIISPENKTLMIRVVSSGPVSQENYPVKITRFYPSDANGNPRTVPYSKGTFAYLTAYVKNDDITQHNLYFAINIYDKYAKPWTVLSSTGTIQPGEEKFIIVGYPISYEFPSGTAVAYAVALTDMPTNNGMPHCPEAKTTFQVETSEITPITTSGYRNGNFYLNFTMPKNGSPGIYTVYATSIYKYSTDTEQLNFRVKVPDLNNDGTVDIYDLVIVATAFGSSEGDQNWNPIADVNGDKTVDIYDVVLIGLNFGWTV